jgi:hypothetical protein
VFWPAQVEQVFWHPVTLEGQYQAHSVKKHDALHVCCHVAGQQ